MHKKTQKIAYLGLLGAAAIALSFAESVAASALALPAGVKPGLSNIAVMIAAGTVSLPAALALALLKAVFALITRGPVAMLMSGVGGLVSALAVSVLIRARKQPFGRVGIGVIGAALHNACQLIIAALLTATPMLIYAWAPVLLFSAVIAGSVTGTLFGVVERRFDGLP